MPPKNRNDGIGSMEAFLLMRKRKKDLEFVNDHVDEGPGQTQDETHEIPSGPYNCFLS